MYSDYNNDYNERCRVVVGGGGCTCFDLSFVSVTLICKYALFTHFHKCIPDPDILFVFFVFLKASTFSPTRNCFHFSVAHVVSSLLLLHDLTEKSRVMTTILWAIVELRPKKTDPHKESKDNK